MKRILTIAALAGTIAGGAAARTNDQSSLSLIEGAKQLSDIRADNSQAFELRATFKVTRRDGTSEDGVYTETWRSPRLWRSEIKTSEFQRIKVARDKTLWTQDVPTNPTDLGVQQGVGRELLGMHFGNSSFQPSLWKDVRIKNRMIDSLSLKCIQSKSAAYKLGLCFDGSNGALVRSSGWLRLEDGDMVEEACIYGSFQKFGEKMFPRSVQCAVKGKPTFEETIVDLTAESTPSDSSLFSPIPDARQTGYCPGPKEPPKALRQEGPAFKSDWPKSSAFERLSVSVGADGNVRDARILQSIGKDYDKASADAIKEWRFRPATCAGEPIETEIEVDFAAP